MTTTTTSPTIPAFLAPLSPQNILVHVETCNSPANHRPIMANRYLGFDQLNAADVLLDCQNMLAFGVCPMFNTYKVGSPENRAFVLYLKEMATIGLRYMVNVDKGVWQNTPDVLQAFRDYISWLRVNCFSQPNYIKAKNGKFVVTIFFAGGEDAPTWQKLLAEAAFSDIVFVSNGYNITESMMWWVTSAMEGEYDWFCKTAASRPNGVHIPGLSHGFDDTSTAPNGNLPGPNPHSTWSQKINNVLQWVKPRVWGPPSFAVLTAMRDALAAAKTKYNLVTEFDQIVTWSDCDEGTMLSPKKDGTGCYFSPVPPPAPPPPPVPVVTLMATPVTVEAGSAVTLSWTATDASGVTIDHGVGAQAATGSVSVTPPASILYTLTASGAGGTATATASVAVTPPPPTVNHLEVWSGSIKLGDFQPGDKVALTVVASMSDRTLEKVDRSFTL